MLTCFFGGDKLLCKKEQGESDGILKLSMKMIKCFLGMSFTNGVAVSLPKVPPHFEDSKCFWCGTIK